MHMDTLNFFALLTHHFTETYLARQTRSGLVMFISLLISQEKLKLSRSAQPGCNVQASVPYSLLGRLKFNLE